jgi:hypothetical protein
MFTTIDAQIIHTEGRPAMKRVTANVIYSATPRWIVAIVVMLLLVACQPIQPPTPAPVTTTTATQTLASGPIGTWTATITSEDILRVVPDFPPQFLCENTGTFTWQFSEDGTFSIDQRALETCPTPNQPHMEDTWSQEGNLITFAKGTPNQEVYEWSRKGDLLTFVYVSGECVPCKAVNTATPWKQTENK